MIKRTTVTIALALFFVALSSLAAPERARAEDEKVTAPTGAEAPPALLIDINEASLEELVRLPGIGPSKARAILEHRERRRFASPAAIQRVKGIGRATYLRLRPHITTGNVTR